MNWSVVRDHLEVLLGACCALLVGVTLASCGGSGESSSAGPQAEKAAGGKHGDDRTPERSNADARDTYASKGAAGTEADAGHGDKSGADRDLPHGWTTSPSGKAKREAALVRQLVDELIQGINTNDESVCTRLFSQQRLEPEKRDGAVEGCRRSITEAEGKVRLSKIELIRINEAKDGDGTGFVQFVAGGQGGKLRYRFHLMRSDAGYVIDALVAFPKKK